VVLWFWLFEVPDTVGSIGEPRRLACLSAGVWFDSGARLLRSAPSVSQNGNKQHRSLVVFFGLAASAVVWSACGGVDGPSQSPVGHDSGIISTDSGFPTAPQVDSGLEAVDAGDDPVVDIPDSGTGVVDAGPRRDAGSAPLDAGFPKSDAGLVVSAFTAFATASGQKLDHPFVHASTGGSRVILVASMDGTSTAQQGALNLVPSLQGVRCKGVIQGKLLCLQRLPDGAYFGTMGPAFQKIHSSPLPIGPNDWTVTRSGVIYATDRCGGAPTCSSSMNRGGVWKITPQSVEQVVSTLENPNGIDVGPNDDTLFVGFSSYKQPNQAGIWKFPILATGSVDPGALFSKVNSPDGVSVNQLGFVAVVAGNGIDLYTPAGALSSTARLPMRATNVAFGTNELFATVGEAILRAEASAGKQLAAVLVPY
jgi:hypothetical protein